MVLITAAWAVFVNLCVILPAEANTPVEIMPHDKVQMYKSLLPAVWDAKLSDILRSPQTLWYDETSIVPSYQDSMGDPEGNRPNTIQSILIDLAVPGGWSRLFSRKGRFNFPFATGGADLSDNLVKINFWSVPQQNAKPLPVVYWKLNFSRWRWLFPVGTVIGEILLVKFPDGDLRVSEIRTREREVTGWTNQIFRPFLRSNELKDAIAWRRPQWQQSTNLRKLMEHLERSNTLTPRTLKTEHFKGAFDTAQGYLDILPDFGDPSLVKELLKDTAFRSAAGIPWKTDGSKRTHAASSASNASIVPIHYDGGMLAIDDVSCRRCHENAGRGIGDFHDPLIAYGELWGEDETFSWHPFETSSFVDSKGDVANFNNDNRRLRQDWVAAGLVERYQPSAHPSHLYREIPRNWNYHPIAR